MPFRQMKADFSNPIGFPLKPIAKRARGYFFVVLFNLRIVFLRASLGKLFRPGHLPAFLAKVLFQP